MGIRIAVATSDGNRVDEHFGRTRRFRIFQLDGKSWQYLEDRETAPACSGQAHSDDSLERAADLIADCRGVVVCQIGPGAIDLLIDRGILPFVLEGEIDEALTVVADRVRHFTRKPAGG